MIIRPRKNTEAESVSESKPSVFSELTDLTVVNGLRAERPRKLKMKQKSLENGVRWRDQNESDVNFPSEIGFINGKEKKWMRTDTCSEHKW